MTAGKEGKGEREMEKEQRKIWMEKKRQKNGRRIDGGKENAIPSLKIFLATTMLMTVIKKRDFSQRTLPSGRPQSLRYSSDS